MKGQHIIKPCRKNCNIFSVLACSVKVNIMVLVRHIPGTDVVYTSMVWNFCHVSVRKLFFKDQNMIF